MDEQKKTAKYDNECYANLANAIVVQAVDDWKAAQKTLWKTPNKPEAIRLKNDSERFFCSDWYKTLCQYPAKDLLVKLPGMAKKELYDDTLRKWINAYKLLQTLKPGIKTNDKRRKCAERKIKDAESDFWSKWFMTLYSKHPEDLIEECKATAEKEIAEEEERKRLYREAKKVAKKVSSGVQK